MVPTGPPMLWKSSTGSRAVTCPQLRTWCDLFQSGIKASVRRDWEPWGVDVIDTDVMERIQTVPTERDAHTLGFDAERIKLYAFLPKTHRAAVYVDQD